MKYISLFLLFLLLTSCGTTNNRLVENVSLGNNTQEVELKWTEQDSVSNSEVADFEEKEVKLDLKNSETVYVSLDSDNTQSDDSWIQISGQKVTIKKSWNYEFSWTLTDWQIVVETEDEKDVQIILNGVNITSSETSAILVENANRTVINLVSWTTNNLIDWDNYSNISDEAENAAIFSRDDLVINWEGTLNVVWNFNDWITSKDKLYIDSWDINVIAADDWIRWKDYLLINSWNINVESEWDSLKSDNDDKWTILINGWNIEISSWDDWINATQYIVINDWNIDVVNSYEALEAKDITFNGWDINLVSSDDWINATSWTSSSWDTEKDSQEERWAPDEMFENLWMDMEEIKTIMDKKRSWEILTSEEEEIVTQLEANRSNNQWREFGWRKMMWWGWGQAEDGVYLRINWWNITLNADWDWLDSNGDVIMTGWNIIVYWPVKDNNGALDYNWVFNISGWNLIAIWSSWMAETPNDTSSQNSVLIWLESTYESWSEIIIKDEIWSEIFNIISKKSFQSIVASSSELLKDSNYTLEINREDVEKFTISDVVTKVWNISENKR